MVNHWANQFSELVTQDVLEARPVEGSLEFLKKYFNQFDFAIVSDSDQKDINPTGTKKLRIYSKTLAGLYGVQWLREFEVVQLG